MDFCQRAKHGQLISGDVFLSEKVKHEDRIVSVLSDGLGSGVKASVLATMTATMALKFAASAMDIRRIRGDHHGYAAHLQRAQDQLFHIHRRRYGQYWRDAHHRARQPAVSSDSPARRSGNRRKTEMRPKRWQDRVINFSTFEVQREDRIVFFSDGITQAGMGEFRTPLGWGLENVEKFVREQIDRNPHISARELSRVLVAQGGRSGWPHRQGRHHLRRGLLPQPAPIAGVDRGRPSIARTIRIWRAWPSDTPGAK